MAKRVLCLVLCVMLAGLCACKKDDKTNEALPVSVSGESVYENLSDDTLWLSAYDIDTINPIFSNSESVTDLAFLMYDSLFILDENMKAVLSLADGYEVSDDGMKYTVFLKNNCRFHDGSAFGADDVIYTISQIRNKGESGKYYNDILNIKDVYSENGKVVITIYSPEPLFINNLCFPIIKNGTAEKTEIPIGTGPYKFVQSTLTRAMYFEINEDYFREKPKMRNAVITIVPNFENQIYALKYHRTDAICINSEELEKYNTGAKRVFYNNMKLTFMGLNASDEFLSYSSARRAISACMDRSDMVNGVLFGNGEAAVLPYPKQSFIYPEKYKDLKKDSAKASEELEKAGFLKGDDGIYVLNGEAGKKIRAEVEILVNSENEKRVQTAEKAANNLKSAGIDAKVKETDFNTYTSNVNSGRYDIYIGEVMLDNSLNTDLLFGPSATLSRCLTQSISDACLKKKGSLGEENIIRAYLELCDVLTNQMPVVCLYFKNDAVLVNNKLDIKNYTVSGNELANISSWVK